LNEVIGLDQYLMLIGSGTLTFNYGAWHTVDSNEFIFKLLAHFITRLLALELASKSNQEIELLLKDSLRLVINNK